MRVLLLSLLMFTSLASFAGDLNVKVWDNSWFVFQLDNNFYNRPERAYDLMNVADGYHYIQVYRIADNGDPGLLFKGYIFVPAKSVVKVTVLKDHRIKVSTQNIQAGPPAGPGGPAGAPPSSSGELSDSEFNDLRSSIEKITLASSKLSTIKSTLQGRSIRSSQVAELMKQFVFDSDKLELAKFCYDIVSDASSFHLINGSFSFESSKEEMNAYIKSRKK